MAEGAVVERALGWTQRAWEAALGVAPTVMLVLGVVLGGWLASSLARRGTRWAVSRLGLEALAEKLGVARLLYTLGVQQGVARLSGEVARVGVLLLTFHSVAEIIGLTVVSQAMTALMGFVPSLLSASGIMVAGVLGADVLARVVRKVGARPGGEDSANFIGKALYYVVIVLAGTVAAEQLGLAVSLINALIQILAGSVGLGLGLAFAFGAREAATHWVARRYVLKLYRVGDRVRVGEHAGLILNFSPTAVILDQGDHELLVPCGQFVAQAVRLERLGERVEVGEEVAEGGEGVD
jgi:type III secretory pathway component EscS